VTTAENPFDKISTVFTTSALLVVDGAGQPSLENSIKNYNQLKKYR